MTKIIPLARCRHGTAKDQETDAETWERELSAFHERVRHNAANLAAHSHDITLVGDRLLISCAWYNSTKWPGTGWFTKDNEWTPISDQEFDQLYVKTDLDRQTDRASNQTGTLRRMTINTEFLA